MFRFFQNAKRSLDSVLNLITGLVADGLFFFRLLFRSRTALSAEVLFLRKQLAFYAKILTSALEHSKYFNVWGLPNFYLEDASRAMVETGKSAAPELKRILSDTRPAPVFGSQEAMAYQQYKYRVCDYALFFLEQIAGKQDFRMPVSPAERDPVIKEMSAK